uniref:ABC transporter family protein n=1 Tax=Rhizophora mucronata TaxID=61149 RepID=A0A2P2KTL5_RHIMU
MELKREVGLLWQQFKALLVKNLLLSWRNKRATFLQLFASLVFILLLFCIDRATRSMNYGTTAYKSVTDPLVSFYPSIPPCEDKLYIKFPCFDFLWSGNDSFRVRNIVRSIMANNPGRAIPSSKVLANRNFKNFSFFNYCASLFDYHRHGALNENIRIHNTRENSLGWSTHA